MFVGCCVLAACAQQRRPTITTTVPGQVLPPDKMRRAPPPATVIEKVAERCPSQSEINRLRAARPKPLRDQKMPATTAERVARTAAQLGLYEAKGQWADQVESAFRQCEDR